MELTAPQARPVVVVGDLEPVIAAGLAAALEGEFTVHRVNGGLAPVMTAAQSTGAQAVVVRRRELAETTTAVTVASYGVSALSYDVLVVFGEETWHLANPTPEGLCDRIRHGPAA